jgi:hypothetical protein
MSRQPLRCNYVIRSTPLVTSLAVMMPAPVWADSHIARLSSDCDGQKKQHDPEIAHGDSHLLKGGDERRGPGIYGNIFPGQATPNLTAVEVPRLAGHARCDRYRRLGLRDCRQPADKPYRVRQPLPRVAIQVLGRLEGRALAGWHQPFVRADHQPLGAIRLALSCARNGHGLVGKGGRPAHRMGAGRRPWIRLNVFRNRLPARPLFLSGDGLGLHASRGAGRDPVRPGSARRYYAARMTRPAPETASGSGRTPSRMIGRPLTNDHWIPLERAM